MSRATNSVQRLLQLDTPSGPVPLQCVDALQVEDDAEIERLVHQAFADHRPKTTFEIFKINLLRSIVALTLARGLNVTPKQAVSHKIKPTKKQRHRLILRVTPLQRLGLGLQHVTSRDRLYRLNLVNEADLRALGRG